MAQPTSWLTQKNCLSQTDGLQPLVPTARWRLFAQLSMRALSSFGIIRLLWLFSSLLLARSQTANNFAKWFKTSKGIEISPLTTSIGSKDRPQSSTKWLPALIPAFREKRPLEWKAWRAHLGLDTIKYPKVVRGLRLNRALLGRKMGGFWNVGLPAKLRTAKKSWSGVWSVGGRFSINSVISSHYRGAVRSYLKKTYVLSHSSLAITRKLRVGLKSKKRRLLAKRRFQRWAVRRGKSFATGHIAKKALLVGVGPQLRRVLRGKVMRFVRKRRGRRSPRLRKKIRRLKFRVKSTFKKHVLGGRRRRRLPFIRLRVKRRWKCVNKRAIHKNMRLDIVRGLASRYNGWVPPVSSSTVKGAVGFNLAAGRLSLRRFIRLLRKGIRMFRRTQRAGFKKNRRLTARGSKLSLRAARRGVGVKLGFRFLTDQPKTKVVSKVRRILSADLRFSTKVGLVRCWGGGGAFSTGLLSLNFTLRIIKLNRSFVRFRRRLLRKLRFLIRRVKRRRWFKSRWAPVSRVRIRPRARFARTSKRVKAAHNLQSLLFDPRMVSTWVSKLKSRKLISFAPNYLSSSGFFERSFTNVKCVSQSEGVIMVAILNTSKRGK